MAGEIFTVSPEVTECAKRIRAANDKFGIQFTQWIAAVGSELRTAQEVLASHKAGFEKWGKAEFGWGRRYLYRIMNAYDTLKRMRPIGHVKTLPTNESQLRELTCVPSEQIFEVWNEVVEHAEEHKRPITAKLIREHTKRFRDDVEPVYDEIARPTGFGESEAEWLIDAMFRRISERLPIGSKIQDWSAIDDASVAIDAARKVRNIATLEMAIRQYELAVQDASE